MVMIKRKPRKKALNSEFADAMLMDSATYMDYLERLKKIALSMFEWVNLPSSMNARYLEMTLYYNGQAALLYDPYLNFINTQAVDSGYINIYGLPTKINCFSYSYNEMRELYVSGSNLPAEEECILVMNNYQRVPTASTLELYAQRLANAERVCDINLAAQKTPVLVSIADKNQELTLRNVYAQYEGNSPVIFADRNLLDSDSVKVMKTDAPFIANDVREYIRQVWNDAMCFLGINNLAEKKERLITSEADSNNELINMNMQSYLIPRKQACKEFNEKFGLTGSRAIDVKLRSDLYNIIKENESIVSEYDIEKMEDTNE